MSLARLNALRRFNRLSEDGDKEVRRTSIGSFVVPDQVLQTEDSGKLPKLNLERLESLAIPSDESSHIEFSRNVSDPHFSSLIDAIYNKSAQREETKTLSPHRVIMIRSVGEIHRQYRERDRGKLRNSGLHSGKPSSSVRNPPKPPPFVCGGRLKREHHSDKLDSDHLKNCPNRRVEIDEDWTCESGVYQDSLEDESCVPSPSGKDTGFDDETDPCFLIDKLSYSAFCANFENRQELEAECKLHLKQGQSVKLRTTSVNSIDDGQVREALLVLRTFFMSVSRFSKNFDGIFPEITTRELDGGFLVFEMVVYPRSAF